MSFDSGITWTDDTFNPWWGCTHKSPGCDNCYAETFAKRFGHDIWGKNHGRRLFDKAKHWLEPVKWNIMAAKANKRRKVFCASMADVFEDRADLDSERLRLFDLIRETPSLDWLLLTKRPENVKALLQNAVNMAHMAGNMPLKAWLGEWAGYRIIPHNVWMGTTVEDQRRADERIGILDILPARHHFLSVEPQLEHIDLNLHLWGNIDWVICGGESGPKARPFQSDWARSILGQCRMNHVPFFMKQFGNNSDLVQLSGKGDIIAAMPIDLRHQEFPG